MITATVTREASLLGLYITLKKIVYTYIVVTYQDPKVNLHMGVTNILHL